MRPDERELDDEIRGHLALAIKERIDRGEDPAAARRGALAELGYVGGVRDSMRRVWYSGASDAVAALGRDIRFALRSLSRGAPPIMAPNTSSFSLSHDPCCRR